MMIDRKVEEGRSEPLEFPRYNLRSNLAQVRGFDHKILDFGASTERKSFGGGSRFGGRRCSEDLLR